MPMSHPGKTFHVRVPPRLQRKLEALHRQHYGGLPIGSLVKLLLADQLAKDESALVDIVAEGIRRPSDATP